MDLLATSFQWHKNKWVHLAQNCAKFCIFEGGGGSPQNHQKHLAWVKSSLHFFYSRSFPVRRSDTFLIGWLRCTEREGGQREAGGLSERENCDREVGKKSRGAMEPGHFDRCGMNPEVAHHTEILLRSSLPPLPSYSTWLTAHECHNVLPNKKKQIISSSWSSFPTWLTANSLKDAGCLISGCSATHTCLQIALGAGPHHILACKLVFSVVAACCLITCIYADRWTSSKLFSDSAVTFQ